ncbi:glycerophosphodiester phosphodiesterase [Paenibacillus allorhizosphaerae]|uniref:GP-PDE domain-containing protein n=1 Tax=Paenibacillus allorhizosphaerae TaxID=2849866 RepID=A0ABM8VAI1_9BACL|nr:glycerophosphodiester phosphodiesterase family protein [Paenibacillus allorhizosphaerae]CAG7616414.1 hypothetical protein PAECIP111802_00285 [Paenibacillus allorhizosphaerae]
MNVRGIAHRGYPTLFPENTLSSFQAALDANYTHLELDVHLSKDGIPVVIHDPTVNRMCNDKGRVKEYTLEELKRFTVGERETIPTLDEALALCKGRISVFLELKQIGKAYEGIEEKVLDVIRRHDITDQIIVTSFDHYSLMKMRELDSGIDIGLIMGCLSPSVFPFMKQLRSRYLWMSHKHLTKEYVQECLVNNIQVIANPIDTEEVMDKLLRQFPSALASTNMLEQWQQFYMQNRDTLG